MDRYLLESLVCPVSKQSLSLLTRTQLARLNELIESGKINNHEGERYDNKLTQALITHNGSVIYPIEADIPQLLESKSIPTVQIPDWH